MATTNSKETLRQTQSLFLALPLELVIEVIAHLRDRRSLCSLARTCRLVQPLCEEQIYQQIELNDTNTLATICDAFARREARFEAVKSLKISYKYHKELADTMPHREVLNNCIGKMKSLREWHIESPFDNFHWGDEGGVEWVDRDMEAFREALEAASLHPGLTRMENIGLAKLERLTIHSHGADADFWELNGYHCLFRHPALKYLHISCVSLPPDLGPELDSFARTTPLTTLIFDECELDPNSLRQILSTPKSLKNLTLGENVANVREARGPAPRLTSSPEAALLALMPVGHSLEGLAHYDPTFYLLPDPDKPPPMSLKGTGMRNFYSLKFIDCDPCSFLHQGIILNHTIAPPNLETLRLRHYSRQSCDFFDQLPLATPYTYLPSLKVMEFAQPLVVRPGNFSALARHICHSEALRERHAFAYTLFKSGVTTKVYAEMHKAHQYIPPYLNGEPVPDLLCLYNSSDVGFRRSLDEPIDSDLASDTGPDTVDNKLKRKRTSSIGGCDEKATEKELPETDQLTDSDIERIRVGVERAIIRYQYSISMLQRLRREDDDDSTVDPAQVHEIGFWYEVESDPESGFEGEFDEDEEFGDEDIELGDDDDDSELDWEDTEFAFVGGGDLDMAGLVDAVLAEGAHGEAAEGHETTAAEEEQPSAEHGETPAEQ